MGGIRTLCREGVYGLSFNGRYLALEGLIRLALGLGIYALEHQMPFVRAVYGIDWYNHYFPYQHHEMYSIQKCAAIWASLMVGLPVLVYITFTVWKRMPWRLIVEDALNFFLGFSLSLLLTFFMTDVLKNMYGRPRPDYLSRCLGETFRDLYQRVEEIPAIPTCTNTNISSFSLTDGRRSFPNGHSSLAMSVYLYLSLFLYRKLCQIKNSGSLRLILPIGLTMFAFAIMVSRTSDYRHFPSDVLIGGAIGTFCALVSWLFYDAIIQQVYATYCAERGYCEGTYIHDPLSLRTPAQFVPVRQEKQGLHEVSLHDIKAIE